MVIDGKAIAHVILTALKERVGELRKKSIIPHLAVILVGDDASSEAYVRQKDLKMQQIDAEISLLRYGTDISEEQLLAKVSELNTDPTIHGIIVQRPLPPHIDEDTITLATNPQKDIDGFHPQSPFTPPIALAVEKILQEIHKNIMTQEDYSTWLQNQKIVILGKGRTAGQPIIDYFHKTAIPLRVIDSKTEQKDTLLKSADIIITAIGKPHILKPETIREGAILIGVGMDRGEDGRMHPDYDEDVIKDKASFYTSVPGGVGPVNVAMLLHNVVLAASKK